MPKRLIPKPEIPDFENIRSKKRGLGGLIIEPILSCGGQVELPKNFLRDSYKLIKKNGGICAITNITDVAKPRWISCRYTKLREPPELLYRIIKPREERRIMKINKGVSILKNL